MYWYWGADLGLVLFVLPVLAFAFYAQARVAAAARRYSRLAASAGKTGAQVARELLQQAGVAGVQVVRTQGVLTDHYDPRRRVLRLSPGVHDGCSITVLGVAAHEAGHAVQHAVGYALLALRGYMAPAVGFGSRAAVPLFFLGLVMGWGPLVDLGLLLFLGVVVFAAVTLPVEYDASARALAELQAGGYLRTEEEMKGVRAVLNAAALTYVAALAVAAAELLRMLLLARRRDD